MAEDIVAELELVGSNGVDFLLTDDGPVVVEVNPRFQGSLDSVELATGQNIFQAHLQSFSKVLPERMKMPCLSAGRAIIYASRDMQIVEDLSATWARDVPGHGCKIGKDDPILSILAAGKGRKEVLALLTKRAASLRRKMEGKK
jgi:predicted ATP-grasp superfamily ATP-dependent carboligase